MRPRAPGLLLLHDNACALPTSHLSILLHFLPLRSRSPGGRFREFYYWDSFWILDGLLLCDMTKTAANVLYNMMDLIDYFGFIPNGARIYFGGRSQPPYFAKMVEMYYNRTGDVDLLKKALPYLDREVCEYRGGNGGRDTCVILAKAASASSSFLFGLSSRLDRLTCG